MGVRRTGRCGAGRFGGGAARAGVRRPRGTSRPRRRGGIRPHGCTTAEADMKDLAAGCSPPVRVSDVHADRPLPPGLVQPARVGARRSRSPPPRGARPCRGPTEFTMQPHVITACGPPTRVSDGPPQRLGHVGHMKPARAGVPRRRRSVQTRCRGGARPCGVRRAPAGMRTVARRTARLVRGSDGAASTLSLSEGVDPARAGVRRTTRSPGAMGLGAARPCGHPTGALDAGGRCPSAARPCGVRRRRCRRSRPRPRGTRPCGCPTA